MKDIPLVRLGEKIQILSGFAFKSENFGEKGDLPLIRIRDVHRGYSSTFYTGEYNPEFVVVDGDILISMDGEFRVNRWSGGMALLNQRVCKISVTCGDLDEGYLVHFLPLELKKIEDATPFVTVKHLSAKSVRSIELPLPPIEEQRRIAAILDKANAIRRKRKQALALADDFLRATFLDMFGDPVTNPKGWEQTTVGDVVKLSSGIGLTAKAMDLNGPYSVYGGNGVTGNHSKYLFEEPKLVIGRVGVYCGAVHVTKPNSWITDNALYVKEVLKADLQFKYMEWAFRMANLNQYADQAAQPLISGGRVYPIKFLLPPKSLQSKFEKITNKYAALQKQLSVSIQIADTFFASISQGVFRGRL